MKRLSILSSAVMAIAASAFGSSAVAYQPAPRSGPKPQGGAGAKRAKARLAAKLKANKAIPDLPILTRQQLRQKDRALDRRSRSLAKRDAMQRKLPGGSAAVV